MNRHLNLLHNEHSALLIVDVQEKFRNHIDGFDPMVKNIIRLIEACKILEIPIFVSEQYPKGLGKTVFELSSALGEKTPGESVTTTDTVTYEKTAFSCCASDQLMDALCVLRGSESQSERAQIIVCGIEAHVCVNQTVHDLIASNFQVHIVEDATASRKGYSKEVGMRKMALAGALPTCTEMALLELVQDSASPAFRAVQALIK